MDLTPFFTDEGVPLDENFIAKASLRVPVRDFEHPVVAHIFNEMRERYLRHMVDLEAGIASILHRAREVKKSLVFSLPADKVRGNNVLMKARVAPAPAPAGGLDDPRKETERPGSRGGKWYRTKTGKIRYGKQPPPQEEGEAPEEWQEMTEKEAMEHAKKVLNPSILYGLTPDIRAAVTETGVMTPEDWSAIDWVRENYLLPQLKEWEVDEMTMEEEEMLGVDPKGLENWLQNLWTEAGQSLGHKVKALKEAWDDMQEKYEKARKDPRVQAALKQRALDYVREQDERGFDIAATTEKIDGLYSDMMTKAVDADHTLNVMTACRDLGMLFLPGKGEVTKKSKNTKGALMLKGTIQPDTAFISDIAKGEYDARGLELTTSQLSAAVAVSALEAMRDPETMKFSEDENAWKAFDPSRSSTYFGDKSGKILARLFKSIETQKGSPLLDADRKYVTERLMENAKALALLSNKLSGHAGGATDVFSDESRGLSTEELQKKLGERQARIDEALKAQEDTSFAIPAAMKGGKWDGFDPVKNEKSDEQPFEYQKKAANWIMKVKRGILAYDAGMGKTASAILAACTLMEKGKIKRSILIMPPVLTEQWPEEIARYAPKYKDAVLDLTPYTMEERKLMLRSDAAKKAKFIIMSSGSLQDEEQFDEDGSEINEQDRNEFVDSLNGLEDSMVVVDEVHTGGYKSGGEEKGEKSVRNRLMGKILENREYAIGMTATPMPNSPIDTYNLLELFAPGAAGSRDQWQGTLATLQDDPVTGMPMAVATEQMQELNARLKPFVFSKLSSDPDVEKEQIPKGLKPKDLKVNEAGLQLKISRKKGKNGLSQWDYIKEGGAIERILDKRIESLKQKWSAEGRIMAEDAIDLLRGGLRVALQRQAAIHPCLIDPSYGWDAPSPKIDFAVQQVLKHFQGGHGGDDGKPIVIAGSLVRVFPILKRRLAEAGIDPNIIGEIKAGVSTLDRAHVQDSINSGNMKVLLLGIASGGAGLNLQKKANAMIELDKPWTPDQQRQVVGRVHRIGQKDEVELTGCHLVNSFDEIMLSRLAGKQLTSEKLLGKEGGTVTEEADEETRTRKRLRAIMTGAVRTQDIKRETFSDEQEASFDEIAASLKESDGSTMIEQLLKDPAFTNPKVNEEAKKKLPPSLRKEWDQAEDRKAWRQKRNERMLSRNISAIEGLIDVMKKEKADPKTIKKKEKKLVTLQEDAKKLAQAHGHAVEAPKGKKGAKGAAKTEAKGAKEPAKAKAAKPGKAAKEAKPAATKAPPKEAAKPAAAAWHPAKSKLEEPMPKWKDSPYKKGSTKKKGSFTEGQLDVLHGLFKRYKTMKEMLTKVEKVWDDEGGKVPYTPKKGEALMREMLAQFHKDGVMNA